jgi:hypothetical protein
MCRANPRFLRMTNGEIFSFFQSEGGPQGDPLMPLPFSILIAKLHQRVLANKTVEAANTYLDDAQAFAHVTVMETIYEEMCATSEAVCGFLVNKPKCIVQSLHPAPSLL